MTVEPFRSILSCGAHIPRLRLPRSVIAEAMAWAGPPGRAPQHGSRAMCNWDEDAVTMAVEAGRSCLNADRPGSLFFCSSTAPFADRDDAVLACAALDLPESTETLNLGASLRAGTRGLLTALRQADAVPTLIIASDARMTRAGSADEMTYGDAAAAVLVGSPREDSLAAVLAMRSIGSDFVDHYRMTGARFDYALEERWVRDESLMKSVPEVVGALLADAKCAPETITRFIVPANEATATRVARACGLGHAQLDAQILAECGNAGAALPILMLAAVLEAARPGELIVLLAPGQGIDALLLRASPPLAARRTPVQQALSRKRDEPSYVRFLSHRGLLDVDFGMRAERDQRTAHTVAYRKRDAINAFKGGRCVSCGTVQFPLARNCVNPSCRATDTQAPHRFADSIGRVKTFTEDWQAYAARPPYIYGNVEFAEGGNLLMEFTDVDPGELKVDDPVRFVFRVKDDDRARSFRRYFWKATKA